MKQFVLFLLLINGLSQVHGQDPITALKIGDRVPDLQFPVLGYQKDSISISDFNGKILLLDFWSTWCKTCIDQFPKLTQLQRQFSDDLVIMPLGKHNPKIAHIPDYYNNKLLPSPAVDLPTAFFFATDTIVHKLFPASSYPLIIWIGRDQRVLAITDHYAVTERNLVKAIDGDTLDFKVKIKRRYIPDEEPFLIHDRPVIEASALAPFNDSIRGNPWVQFRIDGDLQVVRAFNLSVPVIYRHLYSRLRDNSLIPSKQLISRQQMKMLGDVSYKEFGGGTTKGYDNYQMDEFLLNNLFNYEYVTSKKTSVRDFLQAVIQDLDKRLNIKSSFDGEMLILDSP